MLVISKWPRASRSSDFEITRAIMYQSNRSLNILPPGIPRAFDVFSCPGGREFDELSLPEVGHLITAHGGWGI